MSTAICSAVKSETRPNEEEIQMWLLLSGKGVLTGTMRVTGPGYISHPISVGHHQPCLSPVHTPPLSSRPPR